MLTPPSFYRGGQGESGRGRERLAMQTKTETNGERERRRFYILVGGEQAFFETERGGWNMSPRHKQHSRFSHQGTQVRGGLCHPASSFVAVGGVVFRMNVASVSRAPNTHLKLRRNLSQSREQIRRTIYNSPAHLSSAAVLPCTGGWAPDRVCLLSLKNNQRDHVRTILR